MNIKNSFPQTQNLKVNVDEREMGCEVLVCVCVCLLMKKNKKEIMLGVKGYVFDNEPPNGRIVLPYKDNSAVRDSQVERRSRIKVLHRVSKKLKFLTFIRVSRYSLCPQ